MNHLESGRRFTTYIKERKSVFLNFFISLYGQSYNQLFYDIATKRGELFYNNSLNMNPKSVFSPLRLEIIANTEANTLLNLRRYQQAVSENKKEKIWISNPESTRHGFMNGEKRLLEEYHSNNCLFPGDITGNANSVVNCRCFQIFI